MHWIRNAKLQIVYLTLTVLLMILVILKIKNHTRKLIEWNNQLKTLHL